MDTSNLRAQNYTNVTIKHLYGLAISELFSHQGKQRTFMTPTVSEILAKVKVSFHFECVLPIMWRKEEETTEEVFFALLAQHRKGAEMEMAAVGVIPLILCSAMRERAGE